jgi:hypothetical protein
MPREASRATAVRKEGAVVTTTPSVPSPAGTRAAAPATEGIPPGSGAPPKALGVLGATVLGVGSMIGAGIFALLGERTRPRRQTTHAAPEVAD